MDSWYLVLAVTLCSYMSSSSMSAAVHAEYTVLTDNFLLVADASGIWQMTLDGNSATLLPIGTDVNAVAMDYDPIAQTIYWMDVVNDAVNNVSISGGNPQLVVQLDFVSNVEGLAVDPGAQLLFYTDPTRHTISVNSYDGSNEKTIITNTRKPRSIKLDLARRQLYWCDWEFESIFTSAYDGSGFVSIVSSPGSWIYGIALDVINRDIYWTDVQAGDVSVANVDGSHITSANLGSFTIYNPYGIATNGINIYFSDIAQGLIGVVSMSDNDFNKYNSFNFTLITAIQLYSSESYMSVISVTTPHTCIPQCSNLCLPLLSGPECACPDYQTLSNSTHCVSEFSNSAPYILWIEQRNGASYIHGINGEPSNFLGQSLLLDWQIEDKTHLWTSAVADFIGGNIYLVDSFYRSIVQVSLTGDPNPQIIVDSLSSNIGKVAYDWQTGNLYWTDSLFNKIVMTPLSQPNTIKTVVILDRDQPIGLALYPPSGLIFWSSMGVVDKIESMLMSGANRTVLVAGTFSGGHPVSLTIDYTLQMLYWCTQSYIEVIKFDGSGRSIILAMAGHNFIELTFYNNYLYVLEDKGSQASVLWFLNVATPQVGVAKMQLTGIPQCLAVYSALRTPNTSISCGDCDQICISGPSGSALCDCQDSWILASDGQTCLQDITVPDGSMFVYTVSDKLCLLPVADAFGDSSIISVNCIRYVRNGAVSTIDVNYYNGAVYAVVQYPEAHIPFPVVARIYLRQNIILDPAVYGAADASGIAVNWISSNLYWTHNTRGVIMVSRTDGRYERTLLSNLKKPYGIVVEITHRKLYWSEQGLGAIRTANLDGTNVTMFFAIGNPTSLQIDYNEWRLYWLDASGIIHSVGFGGQNHEQFVPAVDTDVQRITDFAIYQNLLALSTQVSGSSVYGATIYFVDKHSGAQLQTAPSNPSYTQIASIVAYSPDNEPLDTGDSSTSCGWANGGCEQLCFGGTHSRTCGCADGLQLASDGHSCIAGGVLQDKFFVLTDSFKHRILQADSSMSNIITLLSPGLDFPFAIAYDFSATRLYWSDSNMGVIKSADLDGSNTAVVFGPRNGSVFSALAFDPRSHLLYYVDSGLNVTGLIAVHGGHHKLLASYNNGYSPQGLAIDPVANVLYYTVDAINQTNSVIEKRNLDGSNNTPFINSQLKSPAGITIDQTEQRVYWADVAKLTIESAKYDGSNRQTEVSTNTAPYSVASVNNYLYYSDKNNYNAGIHRRAKGQSVTDTLGTNIVFGLKTLAYFDSSIASGSVSTCSTNNGGCSHICIPLATGRVCACPDDSQGNAVNTTDGANCPGLLMCPQNIANGHTVDCDRLPGSVCVYTCNNGYQPATQPPSLACLPGLVWNVSTDSLCVGFKCGYITPPPNAQFTSSCSFPSVVGAHCVMSCIPGFQQSGGTADRVCQSNGLWTGSSLQCSQYCPALVQPKNSVAVSDACNTQAQPEGSTCQYYCNQGYSIDQGTPARTCRSDGTWSAANMTCVRNDVISPIDRRQFSDAFFIIGIIICVLIIIFLLITIIAAGILLYKRWKKLRQNEPGFRYAAMSDSVFPTNIHDPSHYSSSPEPGDVAVNTSPYIAAALSHSRPTVNNGYDNGAYASVINEKPMPIGTSLGQGFATAGNFQSPPEYSETATGYQNVDFADFSATEEKKEPIDGPEVTAGQDSFA